MSGRGAITEVPNVPEVRIERDADVLVAEYAQRCGVPVVAPVPVEDILELHLGLTFAIEDLAALCGTDGVLGAIWFNEKQVRIDARPDPSENPSRLGRYRFTLAHEIGNWHLHRSFYREDPPERTEGRDRDGDHRDLGSGSRGDRATDRACGDGELPRSEVQESGI